MHRYFLPLMMALAITIAAIPAYSAEEADSAQEQQRRRVWTNDDLEELQARGLISIVGPTADAAPALAPAAPTEAPRYNSRMGDPAWYADQTAELQAQLNERMAALALARQNLAQARSVRQTTGGINLAEANAGITPEDGIAALEARVSEVRNRFDELSDLARRNYIPPSILRLAAV
jgi:hypothetical protein